MIIATKKKNYIDPPGKCLICITSPALVVKEDLQRVGVTESNARGRVRRRQMICCGDPKGSS